MLYLISCRNNQNLEYRGGQDPIVHLESDLFAAVAWANESGRRWAFTLSNAGATYFEDRSDLGQLGEIDWNAVGARLWMNQKEGKQAEFLIEGWFPWQLVTRIGVKSADIAHQVAVAIQRCEHKPPIEILTDWYY